MVYLARIGDTVRPMADERTYIKLHDGMPDHPKVDGLSDSAFRLLISIWCWSSRHLTDGLVPSATWGKRGTARARAELMNAGLVEEAPSGFLLHDYLEHQRSADEVAALKEKRRQAGSLGGLAKAKAVASAKASAKQTASKTLPESDTETEELETSSSSGPRTRGSRLKSDWRPTADDVVWQRSKGISDDLARRETEKFRNHWEAASGQRGVKADWSKTWRNWMLTALERTPTRSSGTGQAVSGGW